MSEEDAFIVESSDASSSESVQGSKRFPWFVALLCAMITVFYGFVLCCGLRIAWQIDFIGESVGGAVNMSASLAEGLQDEVPILEARLCAVGTTDFKRGMQYLVAESDAVSAAVRDFRTQLQTLALELASSSKLNATSQMLHKDSAELVNKVQETLNTDNVEVVEKVQEEYRIALNKTIVLTHSLLGALERAGVVAARLLNDTDLIFSSVDSFFKGLDPLIEIAEHYGGVKGISGVRAKMQATKRRWQVLMSFEEEAPQDLHIIEAFADRLRQTMARLESLAHAEPAAFESELLAANGEAKGAVVNSTKTSAVLSGANRAVANSTDSVLGSIVIMLNSFEALLAAVRGRLVEVSKQPSLPMTVTERVRAVTKDVGEHLASYAQFVPALGGLALGACHGAAFKCRVISWALAITTWLAAATCFSFACCINGVCKRDGISAARRAPVPWRTGPWRHAEDVVARAGGGVLFFLSVIFLDMLGLLLLSVALLVALLHLAQDLVTEGCDSLPLLSNNMVCTAKLGGLSHSIGSISSQTSLDVGPSRSCSAARVLLCEGIDTHMSKVTLVAAVLGAVVTFCLPKRMMCMWRDAHRSVAAARPAAEQDGTFTGDESSSS